MKLRNTILLGALVALMLPTAGVAQRGPLGPIGPRGVAPLEQWLELRDQLDLTDDQVARLEAIQSDLRAKNAEHIADIEALREELGLPEMPRGEARARRPRGEGAEGQARREPPSEEDREKMREFREGAREDMRAIADNVREAMEAAREVLTEEQRDRMRELARARMQERRERGPRGERGKRPGG